MATRSLAALVVVAATWAASLAAASPTLLPTAQLAKRRTTLKADATLPAQRRVPNRYIVKLREVAHTTAGSPPAITMVRALLPAHAAAVSFTPHMHFSSRAFATYVVIDAPESAVSELAASPGVESIFQDFLLSPAVVTVAPLTSAVAPPAPPDRAAAAAAAAGGGGLRGHARRLASRSGWNPGLDRLDQRAGPLDGAFSFYSSGGVTTDGAGVDVYVLDSGIRYDHAEFGGRIDTALARNFVSDAQGLGSTNASDSCLGHGTFVASQIGGAVVGVAPGVRLIPIRVFSCAGSGAYSSLLAAVDYIVTTAPTTGRKSIVNFSGAAGASAYYDVLAERLLAAGAPMVDSAGNEGVSSCTRSPARAPASFSVGASDASDGWASFSNYGACVNLTAVGVDNIGAWHTDAQAYAQGSGTSFATPLVAGLAATIWGALPANASWATVAGIMTASATRGALTSLPPDTPDLLAYSGSAGGLAELLRGWSSSPTMSSTPASSTSSTTTSSTTTSSTTSSTPSHTRAAPPATPSAPTATRTVAASPTRSVHAGAVVSSTATATRTVAASPTRSVHAGAVVSSTATATRTMAASPTRSFHAVSLTAMPSHSGSRTRVAPTKAPLAPSRTATRKIKPRVL
jgi:aqualysin 1